MSMPSISKCRRTANTGRTTLNLSGKRKKFLLRDSNVGSITNYPGKQRAENDKLIKRNKIIWDSAASPTYIEAGEKGTGDARATSAIFPLRFC